MGKPSIEKITRIVLEMFADEKMHNAVEARQYVAKTLGVPPNKSELERDICKIFGFFAQSCVIGKCSNKQWLITEKGFSIYQHGPKEITQAYLQSVGSVLML